MQRRGQVAGQGAHDKWIIDHLMSGPVTPRVTRTPGKSDASFDVSEGRRLQQAIKKCWAPAGGGLPDF